VVTLTDAPRRKEISLLASLNDEWLKLPLSIVRDVGPAAQTLGGILNISKKETFVSATKISERAWMPLSTARKHLVKLDAHGWIENAGRERTRAGIPRRTCTIKITTKTKAALHEYGILPWWSCCYIKGVGCLPWSAKVLLSVIMARLAAFKKTVELQDGSEPSDDDFWGGMDNLGGKDRFHFSLDRIERETGLHRESIVDAKYRLFQLGIIKLTATDTADVLFPREAFRVVLTPASEGKVFLAFSRGSDSGQ
jgi:hypothetical protein